MPQAITTRGPILAVTESPTMEQLQVWWEAMQSDDLSIAYADSFSTTLATLAKARGVTIALYAIAMGRRYALCRVFEAWNARQAGLAPYGQALSSELS